MTWKTNPTQQRNDDMDAARSLSTSQSQAEAEANMQDIIEDPEPDNTHFHKKSEFVGYFGTEKKKRNRKKKLDIRNCGI